MRIDEIHTNWTGAKEEKHTVVLSDVSITELNYLIEDSETTLKELKRVKKER